MSLAHVKTTYERFGKEDPMYAVLSMKERRGNQWNPDDFFRSGQKEIGRVMAHIEALRLPLRRGRALDFGCGMGRLSQALAEQFPEVVGVDIAESMVANARKWNKYGDRVRYQVNAVDNLACFPDAAFDFVYSSITLQHVPPEASSRYIGEFVRVLRPGGLGVFQIPSGAAFRPGSLRAGLYRFRRHYLRRLGKVLRGQPPVEIHYLPRTQVESLLAEAGGRLLDAVDLRQGRRRHGNFRYFFTK